MNEGPDHLRGVRLGKERKICIDEFGEMTSFGIQSGLLTSTNAGFCLGYCRHHEASL